MNVNLLKFGPILEFRWIATYETAITAMTRNIAVVRAHLRRVAQEQKKKKDANETRSKLFAAAFDLRFCLFLVFMARWARPLSIP